jgi:hypothetical protein
VSVSEQRVEQSLDALYALLPAVHRSRDAQPDGSPGPLRALLRVVAEQVAAVSDELDRLYDNAFIETCEDWVVPYIGDLVGHRPLADVPNAVPSPRVDVANTLSYRRRKGTVTVLERLARDVTGWQSVSVEFFRTLATAEHLAHVRRAPTFTVDLRNVPGASAAGGPFDPNAHLPEVRSIASDRGRYGIPNVGIFAWRLDAKPVHHGEAFQVLPGRFTFDPLGRDMPLVRAPRPLADDYAPAQAENLPLAIGRRALYDELAAFNAALLAAGTDAAQQKTARDALRLLASFAVYDTTATAIPPEKLQIADLSLWDTHRPAITAPVVASVDPVLGRFDLGGGVAAGARVLVDYAGAFPGPYGAAPYARSSVVDPAGAIVRSGPASTPSSTLQNAVAPALANGIKTRAGELYAILEYGASITETAASTTIPLTAGQHLTVRAASGERATLTGPLQITVAPGPAATASLQLEGLLLDGGITVTGTGTLQLALRSCTVRAPIAAGGSIVWNGPAGSVTLDHSFTGPVWITAPDPVRVHVTVSDALVDGRGGTALTAQTLDAYRATLLGPVNVHEIGMLENCIVTGLLTSARTQTGCCRYSYLPRGSHAPHRFRCQPEDAARAASDAAALCDPSFSATALAAIADLAAARCVPVFDALRDDDPAYGRLSIWCPPEIRTGAEDASEMGIFHDLYEPQREANLRARLAEYLGLGLEAGIFYVS